MARILVTGGTGLVGTSLKECLVRKLLNENVNSPFFQFENKFKFVSSKDANLMVKSEVDNLFKNNKYDAIIHLAAHVGGLYKNMNSNIDMYQNNMCINKNIIEACHENNVKRGIFCLSSCVFPAYPSSFPMTEETLHCGKPHESNYGYAHAKRQLEVMCQLYNTSYNRNYICVSPVNLYGSRDNFSIDDGHFVPSAIHRMYNSKLENKRWFSVYGTGNAFRQFLYAPDFARAIVTILFDNSIKDGVFNICETKQDGTIPEYRIIDVIKMISNSLDFSQENINYDLRKSDGVMKKTVSGKKFIDKYPDFEFTPLEEGIKTTVKWMVDNFDDIRK